MTSMQFRIIVITLLAWTSLMTAQAQSKNPRSTGNKIGQAARVGGSFDALAKRASAAREANRIEEAIPLYLQALKIKPTWKEGWWYVGSMFYDGDHYVEA